MDYGRNRSSLISILAIALLVLATASFFYGQVGDEINNDRVIEMSKKGLDDEIIISRIKAGRPKFALTDDDLVSLKKSGVSGKVVAAMLDASVLTVATVKIDGKPCEVHTFGQAKVGGRLGSRFSMGLKSVKQKAYIQGEHSTVVVSPNAKIEAELPPNDTIDNYIVVKLDKKGDRREMEVASVGGAVGAKTGLRSSSIIKTSQENIGGRRYKITCQEKLKKGEYILYVVGSLDANKGVYGKGYDFTVE
jgi:hypothetical protein